ncbi:hypothetical protein [Streptomyces rubradiris]|uniref:Uncharacterized protein n=1 Tax=Streptomyces rubradiris TaxID=285531 RepID=A0ABQ3RCZ6_STRRR|nr:hypothetical protein [Streptomyces rubradiris]GHG94478.1 hypothetical protein GCM10018792_04390 [Streptomyces rubradiris]GHI53700.1 hypothetical protein Srubr_35460 [Streptomyces rubradiris]
MSTPAAPQPAAPLRQDLQRIADKAGMPALVEPGEDGTSLVFSLYPQRQLPFRARPSVVRSWLIEHGIEGDATREDGGLTIMLHLPTATSVRQIIKVLLEPLVRVNAIADRLQKALNDHGIYASLKTSTRAITLDLVDDELRSSIALARLLGTPRIDEGLDLQHPDGIRGLVTRMRYLVSGIVGSAVVVRAQPGSARVSDQLTLRLFIGQADRLAERLARTSGGQE